MWPCRNRSWSSVSRAAGSVRCAATNAGSVDARSCVKCDGQLVQRADDDQGVVLERLRVYQQSTRPVLDYYRERPTFRVVNGAQAPERVADELNAMIDDAAAGKAVRGIS